MADRIIPQDVTTRWNSMYDMLFFVLEYRKAYDKFTADQRNDLRQFELNKKEWMVVEQLADVLMVCLSLT